MEADMKYDEKEDIFDVPDVEVEKAKILANIESCYHTGINHYKENNLELAKEEFVKVIRPILAKPTMRSLNIGDTDIDIKVKLLDAMYHLGKIYLAEANISYKLYPIPDQDLELNPNSNSDLNQNNKYTDHYSNAAGIFQYCTGFAKKYGISHDHLNTEYFLQEAYAVEKSFLSSVDKRCRDNEVKENKDDVEDNDNKLSEAEFNHFEKKIKGYKARLENSRREIKYRLDEIKELPIERIAERTEKVQDIYNDSAKHFIHRDENNIGLIQELLNDCFAQLGDLPEGCMYAIIGLGSLASGNMTPWSDLEFAILINEDNERYKEYFRNLTKLLHIKVINLGETPLRSIGIEVLNNFKTADEADDWFWDDVIDSGFSFDGPDWHACKLPLGRQGYKAKTNETTIDKPDYELIHTPQQLAGFQNVSVDKKRPDFTSDKHLIQALRSVSLIYGNQKLLDTYRQEVRNTEDFRSNALQILEEDTNKFALKLGDQEEGKLFNVKKDIYRLGDRVIEALSNYYNIMAGDGEPCMTVWQKIKRMEEERGEQPPILNLEGAQHLREALAIATELRLRTYTNNTSQEEMLSTYIPAADHLNEEQRRQLVEKTFCVKDTAILHHFYYVMLRVQELTKSLYDNDHHGNLEVMFSNDALLITDDYHKGLTHARFLEYDKALEYLKAAKEEQPENFDILNNMLFLSGKIGKLKHALSVAEQMLRLIQHKYNDQPHHPDIATGYSDLGVSYSRIGKYDEAIEAFKKALAIQEIVFANTPNHPDIAHSYNNLGVSYSRISEYDKAIEAYQKALIIQKIVFVSNLNNPAIMHSYHNLGNGCASKGEYDEAIVYYQKTLAIQKIVFANTPNHPDIANVYNDLGLVYSYKGKYDEAIEAYQKALVIQEIVFASNPNHPDIAGSYYNLGVVYLDKGKYDKAIVYHQQALDIRQIAYKNSPNHPAIAHSYTALGAVYLDKGKYDEAMEAFKKALAIQEIVFASNPNHPSIAGNHGNLGIIYSSKGEYDEAIMHYQKALVIQEIVFASNPNHPDIATSYNNLSVVYSSKGNYGEAIEAYKTALAIRKIVFASTPDHPDIANIYNNLGVVYLDKGEYDEAIEAFKKAFVIQEIVFASTPNHPGIATSYNNLGTAYAGNGEYDKAIEAFEKALTIRQIVFASTPDHPDIANVYNNLGGVYYVQGAYQQAADYAYKAKVIFSIYPNQQNITRAKTNYEAAVIQLGNCAFLQDKLQEAETYYGQIMTKDQVDFNSIGFLRMQFKHANIACNSNALPAAINCQLVLLKIDSSLEHGNYYHNLACFYSSMGYIELANETFLKVLTYTKVTGSLHVEYAQFLIMNINKLATDPQKISNHLYAAIENKYNSDLLYGRLEQNSVCNLLKDIIKEKNTTIITLSSKTLAYYLLTIYPEFIREPDTTDSLLDSFFVHCDNLQDEIAFRLLANALEMNGDDEAAMEYTEQVMLIVKIDNIITGKRKLNDIDGSVDLIATKNFAEKLQTAGMIAVYDERLSDAETIYKKIYQIYNLILTVELGLMDSAINSLATIYLLRDNIEQFRTLKLQGAQLNHELIEFSGRDLSVILATDKQISIAIQEYLWQQLIKPNEGKFDDVLLADYKQNEARLSGNFDESE